MSTKRINGKLIEIPEPRKGMKVRLETGFPATYEVLDGDSNFVSLSGGTQLSRHQWDSGWADWITEVKELVK